LLVSAKSSAAGPTPAAQRRSFGLDLVRAIAILCVLQVHFGGVACGYLGMSIPWAMGYVGGLCVELFFVLSGFLIGGLLLDVAERSPTLRGWFTFLVRRWMRTLPLYVLWIAVLMVIMRPPSRGEYAFAYLTFTQNLFWPMPAGDWFGVSWSLSIEEWFYLLFSSVLLGLTALWRRGAMILTCALFLIIPLALRIGWGDVSNVDAGIRKVAAFRLDAIAYGVVAIWYCRRFPLVVAKLRGILFAGGIGLLAAIEIFAIPLPPWAFYSIVPLCLALCLPAMAALARWPGAALVEWMSTRSYGLYIIHLTLIQVVDGRKGSMPPLLGLLIALIATLVLADLLYRFFERPILRLRPPQRLESPPTEAAAEAVPARS
jgi:peptidoglycan/LPS O-acetylase OafA/YrhL